MTLKRKEFIENLETMACGWYNRRPLNDEEMRKIQEMYRKLYKKDLPDGMYYLCYTDGYYGYEGFGKPYIKIVTQI